MDWFSRGWVLLKLLTGIWRHKLSFFFVKERGETCISICLPQATSLLQVYTFYYDTHQLKGNAKLCSSTSYKGCHLTLNGSFHRIVLPLRWKLVRNLSMLRMSENAVMKTPTSVVLRKALWENQLQWFWQRHLCTKEC